MFIHDNPSLPTMPVDEDARPQVQTDERRALSNPNLSLTPGRHFQVTIATDDAK
jgi:hypothetical protein